MHLYLRFGVSVVRPVRDSCLVREVVYGWGRTGPTRVGRAILWDKRRSAGEDPME